MSSTAAAATYEVPQNWNEMDDEEMRVLTRRLNELHAKQEKLGPKKGKEVEKPQAEFPDLTREREQLAQESESVWSKAWSKVKKACDFLIVKPAKWIGRQIKEHPVLFTLLMALAAWGIFQWPVLNFGYSGPAEAGAKAAAEILGKGISVDPTLAQGGLDAIL